MNLSGPSLLLYFTSSGYQSEFLDLHFNSGLSSVQGSSVGTLGGGGGGGGICIKMFTCFQAFNEVEKIK